MVEVTNRRAIHKLVVRAAGGALVAVLVSTVTSGTAEAAPSSNVRTPLVTQSIVGLSQGAQGAEVRAVQQALLAAGITVRGGADGQFGPATRTALLEYQRREGLAESGQVDTATAAALGLVAGPAPTPTTSTPPSTVFAGLQQGSSGAAVVELQQKLMAAGVYVAGGADGQFGAATTTAVKNYQRWNGLTQTGVVDAATAAKLGLTGAGGSSTPAPTPTPPTPTPVPDPLPAPDPATPPAATNPYVGLTVGARGVLVADVQRSLIAAGIAVRGGADGVFGNATKTALTSYQQTNGLAASGVVDAATAANLGLGVSTPTPTPTPTPVPDPPTASTNPYVGLTVGARGAPVKDLQEALIGTGVVVRGGADGVFGNATKTSLMTFQGANGITPTGVVTERGAGILGLGTSTPVVDPPAPSGFGTPGGFPTFGESSERVRLLQTRLIAWNITVYGGADGSFGNATAKALRDFQSLYGLTVTGTVTQESADKLALSPTTPATPPPAGAVTLARFPIQGKCYFGDTWQAPRGGNRVHEGVDIIAKEGNLLYAVVDGTITKQYWDYPGALAGNGLRVAQDDGTYFTYLHLSAFVPGIGVGTKVLAGDVIGYVGTTGSSATPHLHFEIHPNGGAAVNPYPYVKAIDDCNNTTPQYQGSFAPAAPADPAAGS